MSRLQTYMRALRLPFVTASILPFLFGSFLARGSFKILPFFLGLVSVVATHLGANLFNDYADSKSGADWQDKNFYPFFGGSKLIQEGVLSEKFYLHASLVCLSIATLSVILLTLIMGNILILIFYGLIVLLGFSYSHRPLQLSYRRLGEFVIFILFGPALVMGAYFIQTQIFPAQEGFLLSLPFGLFTTAILFSNEIPDYPEDRKVKKITWVSLGGQRKGFVIYLLLMLLGFAAIAINIALGYLGKLALFSFLCLPLMLRASHVLWRHATRKTRLLESSQLTIILQALVSVILVLDVVL